MKAILLCAGFGTRLYPLTENQAKPLLPIAGKPLINYVIEKFEPIKELNEVVLISNGLFYQNFIEWKNLSKLPWKVTVVNDQTMDNDHRLGAIRDLKLGLDQAKVNDDILLLAGDNLFDEGLKDFVEGSRQKSPGASVGVYEVKSRELAQKYGLIKTDSSGRITEFFEKPKNPSTLLASMGVYFFPKETLPFVARYLENNQNPDAPGFYLSWFIKHAPLYAFRFGGTWFDIGDINSYQTANQYFENLK